MLKNTFHTEKLGSYALPYIKLLSDGGQARDKNSNRFMFTDGGASFKMVFLNRMSPLFSLVCNKSPSLFVLCSK